MLQALSVLANRTQLLVLAHALGDDGATLASLGSALGLTDRVVHRAVSALASAGLLRTAPSGAVVADLTAARRLLEQQVARTPLGGRLEARPDLAALTSLGRLVEIPSSPRARAIVASGVAEALPPFDTITERDLGEHLGRMTDDVAGLRRLLVDEGLLDRTPDGASYTRARG